MPTVTVRVVVNQDDDDASSVTSVRVIAQWLDNGITTGSHDDDDDDDDDLINTNDTNANNTRSIR